MIDWIPFDRETPPSDGQYLVYCVAPQWDAEWIDIARCDDGQWHDFRANISHHDRVKYYAEINYPPTGLVTD